MKYHSIILPSMDKRIDRIPDIQANDCFMWLLQSIYFVLRDVKHIIIDLRDMSSLKYMIISHTQTLL